MVKGMEILNPNNKILDLLVCPKCKGDLFYDQEKNKLICKFDNLEYSIVNGIPVMLVDEVCEIKQD